MGPNVPFNTTNDNIINFNINRCPRMSRETVRLFFSFLSFFLK